MESWPQKKWVGRDRCIEAILTWMICLRPMIMTWCRLLSAQVAIFCLQDRSVTAHFLGQVTTVTNQRPFAVFIHKKKRRRGLHTVCVYLLQISMSVSRGRKCVEPIRSVETRSGRTHVIILSRAVPVTSLTTKAAAAKVIGDARNGQRALGANYKKILRLSYDVIITYDNRKSNLR